MIQLQAACDHRMNSNCVRQLLPLVPSFSIVSVASFAAYTLVGAESRAVVVQIVVLIGVDSIGPLELVCEVDERDGNTEFVDEHSESESKPGRQTRNQGATEVGGAAAAGLDVLELIERGQKYLLATVKRYHWQGKPPELELQTNTTGNEIMRSQCK